MCLVIHYVFPLGLYTERVFLSLLIFERCDFKSHYHLRARGITDVLNYQVLPLEKTYTQKLYFVLLDLTVKCRHNNGMVEEKKFTLRIPNDLHERVKILSGKENRSLNKEILELIKRGMESEATKQLRFFE